MSINYELYKVFFCVVKNGSITNAAKELFISQPAVSQSIKQLESQLGGKLFKRTPKGMELTAEGSAIFEYIERANGLIEQAETRFSQMKSLLSGSIRIGASNNICNNFLFPFILRFKELYPNEMEVYYESDDFVCYRVRQNEYSLYNFAIDYGYNGYDKMKKD